ncbi:MAG: TIGR02757 family protein [Bacteroidetes bacterium]|nr:MAG: TIGR02757 family protein [Bacteroidota bacterium]
MDIWNLKEFFDRKANEYNQPSFIKDDPISVPHQFGKKQDIEIAAFFSAIFAWGNRTTIIQKSNELMRLMEQAPHDFVLNHNERHLKKLLDFKHRTFNSTDLLYFVHFLQVHYQKNDSLERAFIPGQGFDSNLLMENALNSFSRYFFSLDNVPARTKKHIASPEKKSSCKRLNMFLRWMVRSDDKGVDFGIWKEFKPSQLICPIDLHVARVAKRFGLVSRKQTDWTAALELTDHLRKLDDQDPVKYDFALFGLGVIEHY